MQGDLLKEVRDFIGASGLSKSAFGRRAVNDSHLMKRIETGSVTLKTVERVRTFIASEKEARGLQ